MNEIQPFQPPAWLKNAHLQTIIPRFLRPNPPLALRQQRLELVDGDFLDLFHSGRDGPIVVVLHGLGGSLTSRYARCLLKTVECYGWHGVFVQFRGYGSVPNRLPRFYHAGETGDIQIVLQHLSDSFPGVPIYAVGYSIGGNMLLKYLGEYAGDMPLKAAVAVSVPFDLHKTVMRLDSGLSRLYQWTLIRQLKRDVLAKFERMPSPVDLSDIHHWRSFYQFDENLTAPLHGFKGAEDYYHRSSCRAYLKQITTPTLLLHAKDDPFMTDDSVPDSTDLAPVVELELYEHGGHVGFFEYDFPGGLRFWLDDRIAQFIKNDL